VKGVAGTLTELGLEERIKRLQEDFDASFAKEMESVPQGCALHLLVSVGKERLALPIRNINRLVRDVDVIPLPGAPQNLMGVMNLRGDLVAVYDLPTMFGGHDSEDRKEDIVVMKGLAFEAGIAVSAVGTLVALKDDNLGSVPSTVPASLKSVLRGTTYLSGELLLFLDLDQLFARLDARG